MCLLCVFHIQDFGWQSLYIDGLSLHCWRVKRIKIKFGHGC